MFKRAIILSLLAFMASCARYTIPDQVKALSFYDKVTPIQRQEVIVLDAGHGGRDCGAASHRENYEEKSLALTTTFMVQERLKKMGYEVILTRNHDVFIPLTARADLANALDADLFVSIHYNYAISESAKGIEVYYYKEEQNPKKARIVESRKLAQNVLHAVVEATHATSRGVKQANFAVVRQTVMPAILIEAGFLSNQQERELLRSPGYLRNLADGIAKGIDKYLTL